MQVSNPEFDAEDYVHIRALQHFVFCPRRAALIHIERLWHDDAATTVGSQIHERIDETGTDVRSGVRVVRRMTLTSHALRVKGIADMVELWTDATVPGGFRPVPIEVKKGKRKSPFADRVQLSAQALCLEEMYGVHIAKGAIFHAESHRRETIDITDVLRTATIAAATQVNELFATRRLPKGVDDRRKCKQCSMLPLCMPDVMNAGAAATTHLFALALGDDK